jgi:sigma-B regulation protein RsbU (phosphoserine phosphatase)
MSKDISLNNTSFNYLKGSSEFLNLVLNNVSSCVLLLNREMKLIAFNDSIKTIFSNKKNEDLQYHKCGNAIGCAYAVEEEKECGQTTRCNTCDIRISSIKAYVEKKEVFKEHISREFYTSKLKKELRHLQFSARIFNFEKDTYIILIVDDISRLIKQDNFIESQKKRIEELLASN